MAKTALIVTTTASEADCSNVQSVTGIEITATEPANTAIKIVTKIDDGKWQHWTGTAWADVATQTLTGASVISEGNTVAELTALVAANLTAMAGKKVNFGVALQIVSGDASPSITSIKVKGQSGSKLTTTTVNGAAITLSDQNAMVDILDITVDKTETEGGTVSVLASIQTDSGWSEYVDYKKLITSTPTQAKAIQLKAILNAPTPGTSVAKLNSVEIKHRVDSVAVFSEGTGVCVTKTYNFVEAISRGHLMVKHPIVPDTEVKAFISLRTPPTSVSKEIIGTGDGVQHTTKLKNISGLASHGFVLYFDGTAQASNTYSYSPNDGQVTWTAPAGVTVSADYIYGWTPEKFVEMSHDTVYPDKNDNTLVDDQFDYAALSDTDPVGSVGTVRVELTQLTGSEKNVSLGTADGTQQSYKLAHHAKPETIVASPSTAVWKYKDNTDVLLITGTKGDTLSVSYSWAARPNYLESIVCIFNE